MRYFKYALHSDPVLLMQIHEIVYRYKPLAAKMYKSNWEDALNDAYFHVVENYNPSSGELEPYICSIIKTIYLNKFSSNSKEVYSDTVLDLGSAKRSIEMDYETNPYSSVESWEENTECGDSLENCIQDFLPYFVKDFEFFVSRDTSKRKLRYTDLDLFNRYSTSVIFQAMDTLSEYYDDVKYLKDLAKSCHIRNFDSDRYKASKDKTLEYITRIGDIVRCRVVRSNRLKCPYLLDISDVIKKLFNMFYSEKGIASRVIHNRVVYCTLSGQIVFSKEDLYDHLERELIGSILAMRNNFKVLNYEKGSEIIFTSSGEVVPTVVLSIFRVGIYIPLTRLVMGRLEK